MPELLGASLQSGLCCCIIGPIGCIAWGAGGDGGGGSGGGAGGCGCGSAGGGGPPMLCTGCIMLGPEA